MMFQFGDIVKRKDGKKFKDGNYSNEIISTWFDFSSRIFLLSSSVCLTNAELDKLTYKARENSMNERSAELLERVAQLIREGENPVKYFQIFNHMDKEWENLANDAIPLLTHIYIHPDEIREKPQTMNLGGYEIPMPIQEEPYNGKDVYGVNLPFSRIDREFYFANRDSGCYFRANLLHENYKSAQDHLNVLMKLHGVE